MKNSIQFHINDNKEKISRYIKDSDDEGSFEGNFSSSFY